MDDRGKLTNKLSIVRLYRGMEHTKLELERLVSETQSYSELVRRLYGKDDGNSWRKGKHLIEKLGVDISCYRVRKYTKKKLEPIVARNKTMSGVVRELGLKPGGGSQQFIKKRIKEFEIDCSHFEGRKFPRSKYKTPDEVLVAKPDGSIRSSPQMLKRCLIEIGREYKCEADGCQITEQWIDRPISLQIHHCDGNCLNNRPENLMFLYPNCHSQTSNWCNKAETT
jgi:hypothetical protein